MGRERSPNIVSMRIDAFTAELALLSENIRTSLPTNTRRLHSTRDKETKRVLLQRM